MLASLLVLALVAPSSQSGARSWPVGLRAMEEQAGSREFLLASAEGGFTVTRVGNSIVVTRDWSLTFAYAWLRIEVTPEGATASVEESTCTGEWKPANLAGCVALVTDGAVAVLDFELYDGERAEATGRYGRVNLGEAGVELALSLARRPAPPAVRRPERQAYRAIPSRWARDPAEERGPREASGALDAFGRRQGTWLVRDEGLELPRLKMGWRDGVPDGPFVVREGGTVVATGRFRMGVREASPALPESAAEVETRRRLEGLYTRR